jgi:ATP-dependent helicase/nuclease subunit A
LKLSEVFLVNNDSEVPFRERSFPTVETIKRADGGLNKFIEFKSKFCLDLRNAKILYQNFLAANSTIIIHNFANAYLKKYSQLKSNKGYLDFDDQILLVKKLLSKSSMAQWVMYKLDGGIEHILIDEAQDTSPDQ